MRVFVTGGSGFIGSVVVRKLLDQGHAVRCALRASSNTDRIADLAFERFVGDVRDAKAMLRGVEGCDAVIHLACLSSWDLIDSPEMEAVVVEGTENVLAAARQAGQLRVVYVSSVAAVDGTAKPRVLNESATYSLGSEPGLTYSHHKHRAEELCRAACARGLPVVIVNPAETYGPNDVSLVTAATLVDFARSNPVLVCHGGSSIAHVDDVALGVVRATERGQAGERYILGGDNVTVRELCELSLELMGRKKVVMTVPNGILRGVTRLATSLRIPLPYNPKVIPYATRYWFMDNSKARQALDVGFRSARDTIAPTLDWLQEAGHI